MTPNVREIMPQVSKQIVTYGLDPKANVHAENVVAVDGQMQFDCVRVNGSISRFPVTLNLPGMHNVLNALAAIAVATEVGAGRRDRQGAGRVQGRRPAFSALR